MRSRAGARPGVRKAAFLAWCILLSVALGPPAVGSDTISSLRPVQPSDLPALLDDGDLDSLRAAVQQSLAWLDRQAPSRRFVLGPRTLTAAEQAWGLRRLLALLSDDPAPDVLEERVLAAFDVLASVGRGDGAVLHTGYHEPIIEASETPSREYAVPILGLPRPLDPAGPRPTRAEIEAGRFAGAVRPLAWARDPVDVFFMEVEGSGTLRLPDGREIRVGPAATNRRRYRSIGRLLIDEGRLTEETMSMHAIRAWLAANPGERTRVLRHNESFVFFRRLSGAPLGSLGVPLTPTRSIATDARVFPPGALAFVRAERPRRLPDGTVAWGPVSRLVLNQDTGGAIRGPGRVDLFWGRGVDADLVASEMKQVGELYFLAPKLAPAPSAPRP